VKPDSAVPLLNLWMNFWRGGGAGVYGIRRDGFFRSFDGCLDGSIRMMENLRGAQGVAGRLMKEFPGRN